MGCGTCCCLCCICPYLCTCIAAIIVAIESLLFVVLNLLWILAYQCIIKPPQKESLDVDFFEQVWSWFIYDSSTCYARYEAYDQPSWLTPVPDQFLEANGYNAVTSKSNFWYQITFLILNALLFISCFLLICGSRRKKLWSYILFLVLCFLVIGMDTSIGGIYIHFISEANVKWEEGDRAIFSMIFYYFRGFLFYIINLAAFFIVFQTFLLCRRERNKDKKLIKKVMRQQKMKTAFAAADKRKKEKPKKRKDSSSSDSEEDSKGNIPQKSAFVITAAKRRDSTSSSDSNEIVVVGLSEKKKSEQPPPVSSKTSKTKQSSSEYDDSRKNNIVLNKERDTSPSSDDSSQVSSRKNQIYVISNRKESTSSNDSKYIEEQPVPVAIGRSKDSSSLIHSKNERHSAQIIERESSSSSSSVDHSRNISAQPKETIKRKESTSSTSSHDSSMNIIIQPRKIISAKAQHDSYDIQNMHHQEREPSYYHAKGKDSATDSRYRPFSYLNPDYRPQNSSEITKLKTRSNPLTGSYYDNLAFQGDSMATNTKVGTQIPRPTLK